MHVLLPSVAKKKQARKPFGVPGTAQNSRLLQAFAQWNDEAEPQGRRVGEIAREHRIPAKVLHRRTCADESKRIPLHTNKRNRKMGPRIEQILVEHIKELDTLKFGLSPKDIQHKMLAVCPELSDNNNSNRSAYYRFMKRHPELKTVVAKQLDHKRLLDKDTVLAWFRTVDEAIAQVEQWNGEPITPDLLLNSDEAGFTLDLGGNSRKTVVSANVSESKSWCCPDALCRCWLSLLVTLAFRPPSRPALLPD